MQNYAIAISIESSDNRQEYIECHFMQAETHRSVEHSYRWERLTQLTFTRVLEHAFRTRQMSIHVP